MDAKEKRKNKIIIVIVLILIAVAAIVIIPKSFSNSTGARYGKYTCIKDDGTLAIIKLSETSVYFENIDYDSAQEDAAISMALDELNGENDDIEVSAKEIMVKQKEYLEVMDYKERFDKKTMDIVDIAYYPDCKQYTYFVQSSDKSRKIDIYFFSDDKKITCGGLSFKYAGKE